MVYRANISRLSGLVNDLFAGGYLHAGNPRRSAQQDPWARRRMFHVSQDKQVCILLGRRFEEGGLWVTEM